MTRTYEVGWVLRPNAALVRKLMKGRPRNTIVMNYDQGTIELQADSVDDAKKIFGEKPPYAIVSPNEVYRLGSTQTLLGG